MIGSQIKVESYTMNIKSVATVVLGVCLLLALATYSYSFTYTGQPKKAEQGKELKFVPLNPLIVETAFLQGAIAVVNLRSVSDREVSSTLQACDMAIDLAMVCLPELIATSVRNDLSSSTTDQASKLALRTLQEYERDFKKHEASAIPAEFVTKLLSTLQDSLKKSVEPAVKHVELLLSASDLLKLAASSVPLTADEKAFINFLHHMVAEQRLVVVHHQENDLMYSPNVKVAVAAIRSELLCADLLRRAKAMGMLEARPSLSVWLARDLIRIAHANDESSDAAWFGFMRSILFYRDKGGEEVLRAMLQTLPTFDKKLDDQLGAIALSNVDASEFQKQVCNALEATDFGTPAIRFCEMLAATNK